MPLVWQMLFTKKVLIGLRFLILIKINIERCLNTDGFSESSLKKYDEDLKKEFGRLLKFSHYALRAAKFKGFFLAIANLLKKKIERKAYKIIEKRSY